MQFKRFLSIRNMQRKPARTLALMLLAALLSMTIFAGAVVITSLTNGLRSYTDRLGADVVVVPYKARTKGNFESILLQGIPGTFYMDAADYEKVRTIAGVEKAAPQFYLASATASCCSASVQIIGFDPELDFTVKPWIRQKYTGELADGDIIVGSSITVPKNGILTFYDTDCRVAAKLDETGTGLDTAVYANMNTIRAIMRKTEELGFHYFDDVDPDTAVSSVMVKVADGASPEKVAGDINVRVRHIQASQAASMVSGIAAGLQGVTRVIGALSVLIWILAVVILIIAFAMISHERTREFAVLRVIGASKRMVSGLLLMESAMICAIGAAAGVLLSLLIVFSFRGLITASIGLPYLMPSGAVIALLALGAVILTVLSGSFAAAVTGGRIIRSDAGLLLRDNV